MERMAEIEGPEAGRELFVLTDEQILGIEEAGAAEEEEGSFDSGLRKAQTSAQDDRRGVHEVSGSDGQTKQARRMAKDKAGGAAKSRQQEGAQTGVSVLTGGAEVVGGADERSLAWRRGAGIVGRSSAGATRGRRISRGICQSSGCTGAEGALSGRSG